MRPPKGHSSVMATNPKAITSPGTASGIMASASSAPLPRIVPRTDSRAHANPTTTAAAVAAVDSSRLLRMLPTASGWESASRQPSIDAERGSTVPYHCPGGDRLASTVPRCGKAATTATDPSSSTHATDPSGPTTRSRRAVPAFACSVTVPRPAARRPAAYRPIATTSITATSA